MKLSLKEYGLNQYENDSYLVLVREGISTASQICAKSAVPHGKIYPILQSLERKGFVKLYDGTPKRYSAVDPKIIIEEVIRKKEQEVHESKERSKKIMQELGELSLRKPKEPLEHIKIIEGQKNYLNLSVSLHGKTKNEWCTISRLPLYKPHLDAYRDCIARGIRVRVIAKITDANRKNVIEWKKLGVELRELDTLNSRFSIMDDTDVIIRLSGEERYLALWIKSSSLAFGTKKYFEFLWAQAKEV